MNDTKETHFTETYNNNHNSKRDELKNDEILGSNFLSISTHLLNKTLNTTES